MAILHATGIFQISTKFPVHHPGHHCVSMVFVGFESTYTSFVCVFLVRPKTRVILTSSSSYAISGLDVSRVSRASVAPVSACRQRENVLPEADAYVSAMRSEQRVFLSLAAWRNVLIFIFPEADFTYHVRRYVCVAVREIFVSFVTQKRSADPVAVTCIEAPEQVHRVFHDNASADPLADEAVHPEIPEVKLPFQIRFPPTVAPVLLYGLQAKYSNLLSVGSSTEISFLVYSRFAHPYFTSRTQEVFGLKRGKSWVLLKLRKFHIIPPAT